MRDHIGTKFHSTSAGERLAAIIVKAKHKASTKKARGHLGDEPSLANYDFRMTYTAIANYHNTLVQSRFTVVGLVLAANGFLVSAFIQIGIADWLRFCIPILGALIGFICWLLEVRTYHLLDNLTTRGLAIEEAMQITMQGFFSLMKHQDPRVKPVLIPTKKVVERGTELYSMISHSFGIGVLYIILMVFWLLSLFAVFVGT